MSIYTARERFYHNPKRKGNQRPCHCRTEQQCADKREAQSAITKPAIKRSSISSATLILKSIETSCRWWPSEDSQNISKHRNNVSFDTVNSTPWKDPQQHYQIREKKKEGKVQAGWSGDHRIPTSEVALAVFLNLRDMKDLVLNNFIFNSQKKAESTVNSNVRIQKRA